MRFGFTENEGVAFNLAQVVYIYADAPLDGDIYHVRVLLTNGHRLTLAHGSYDECMEYIKNCVHHWTRQSN